MGGDAPPPLAQRFFHACLLVLGGIVAVWLAVWALGQFWGWLLLLAALALAIWLAIAIGRYWWGRRW